MALRRPPAAARLSLLPAVAWILRKTRSFPSPAHAGLDLNLEITLGYLHWTLECLSRAKTPKQKPDFIEQHHPPLRGRPPQVEEGSWQPGQFIHTFLDRAFSSVVFSFRRLREWPFIFTQ
jgi:hypothetical protein